MPDKGGTGKRREEAEAIIDRHVGLLKRLDRAVESMKDSLKIIDRRPPPSERK